MSLAVTEITEFINLASRTAPLKAQYVVSMTLSHFIHVLEQNPDNNNRNHRRAEFP